MRNVLKTVCCVCQRKKTKKGWVKRAVKQSKELSHGYCPECYHEIMQSIRGKVYRRRLEEKVSLGF